MNGPLHMAPERPDIEPVKAVLTREEVAQLLQVSVKTVDRLPIPSVLLGPRTRRYLARDVIAFLEERAQ